MKAVILEKKLYSAVICLCPHIGRHCPHRQFLEAAMLIEQLSVALDQLKRALYREGHAIAFNEELNQDQWEEYNV
jgi:hypothetical protein